METIVIEDDLQSKTAVIDLMDENSNDCIVVTDSNTSYQFEDIYKENKSLGDFIDKCVSLDKFGEMARVMNNVFIPLYKETSDDFRKSVKFERALTKALRDLEVDPDHKYAHIRNFCQVLKSKRSKRRVMPITLSKNVSGTDRKRRQFIFKKNSKQPKLDNILIDLDGDCDSKLNVSENIPTINLDDHTVDVADTEKLCNTIDLLQNSDDINYESKCEENMENVVTILDVVTNDSTKTNENRHVSMKHFIEIDMSENHFGVQQETNNSGHQQNLNICKADKIKDIEKEIATYKDLIDRLEETEVLEDNWNSPYVECEVYQKKILVLYKELCTITGDEPVKRHTVRLKASDTRSNLPMQKLEAMINNSIKSNGMPTFPDFGDVVNCVTEANVEGNLGWSKNRVMHEARVLFTHCGRALQRSRQKREWRSVLSRVKCELRDPADYDPELRTRLEANHQMALKKENDIIERFSALESGKKKSIQLEDEQDILNKMYPEKYLTYDNNNDTFKENSQVGHTHFNNETTETQIKNNVHAQNFEVEHAINNNATKTNSTSKEKETEQRVLTADHLIISEVFSCKKGCTDDVKHKYESDNCSIDIEKTNKSIFMDNNILNNNENNIVDTTENVSETTDSNTNKRSNNNNNVYLETASSDKSLSQNNSTEISSTAQCNDNIRRLSISQETGGLCETDLMTCIYHTAANIQVTKIEIDDTDISVNKDDSVNTESTSYNSNKNEEIVIETNEDQKEPDSKSKNQSAATSNIVDENHVKEIITGQCSVTEDIKESLCRNIDVKLNESVEAINNVSNTIIKEENNAPETFSELCQKSSSILECDKSALSNMVSKNSIHEITSRIEAIKSECTHKLIEEGSGTSNNKESDKIDSPFVNVKSEPDLSEFREIGQNFSVSIDIIDPYLIVEISSDSSSEDEMDFKMDIDDDF